MKSSVAFDHVSNDIFIPPKHSWNNLRMMITGHPRIIAQIPWCFTDNELMKTRTLLFIISTKIENEKFLELNTFNGQWAPNNWLMRMSILWGIINFNWFFIIIVMFQCMRISRIKIFSIIWFWSIMDFIKFNFTCLQTKNIVLFVVLNQKLMKPTAWEY